MSLPTPEGITYGLVVARWLQIVGDTPADLDALPDTKPMSGSALFTRKQKTTIRADSTQPDGTYVGIAKQNINGYLRTVDGELARAADSEDTGLWLVTGVYTVSFSLSGTTWPSFDIEVTAAHTAEAPLDLITTTPYVPPIGATPVVIMVPASIPDGYLLAKNGASFTGIDPATLGGAGAAPDASETAKGIVELATSVETVTGDDATRATTPAGVKAALDVKAASDMSTFVAQANLTVTPGASISGSNTGDQTLPTWTTLAEKPAVIAAGTTQAAARTAIGAGTSNLTIGTTSTTAKAGNYSPPAASTTAQGIVELATTAEATTGTDTTRAVTPAGVAAAIAGVGGGVTDHGLLSGLADDDHAQYALADGSRGAFAATSHTHTASQISDSTTTGRSLITAATATAARTAISAAPALGSDDNYVTNDEKLALHTHSNAAALALVSGTNTGDQDLSELAAASHDHTAADIDSGTALSGQVLTANGSGAAGWLTPTSGVTDHGLLSGLADDDHAQYALADGSRGAFAATSHTHTASQISDSTTTGRSLITAATATAARTAISAAPALGSDDNYVTNDEKLALHSHSNKTALDAVSGTNTGDQDLSSYLTSTAAAAAYAPISGQFAVNTVAASGATETLPATHAAHKVTMDENCTFTFTSPTAGHAFVLLLLGAFTPTWPASVDWAGGAAPTYAGAGTLYHFVTVDGGTTWLGSGQAYS